MREILFKAKRKDWEQFPKEEWWIEGNIIEDGLTGQVFMHAAGNCVNESDKVNEEGCLKFFAFEVDPETICQYTGLTDKNGKKIWENDIVLNEWCFVRGNSVVKFGKYKDLHMTEKYQCGNLGFYLEHTSKKENGIVRKDIIYFAGKCEVIGNIFDGGIDGKRAEEN